MSEYEFTISLRIRHPDIDPKRITATLGIDPQHTWQAGEVRRAPAGDELEGVYRESYWTARLMEEPLLSSARLSVESLIQQILVQLRRSQTLLEQISTDGGVAELQVSLFARTNFRLEQSAESLAAFDRLRLALIFEVHPHSPFDQLQNVERGS